MTDAARRRAALYTLEVRHSSWQRTETKATREAVRRDHLAAAVQVPTDVLEDACALLRASWPSSYAPPFSGDLEPYLKRVQAQRHRDRPSALELAARVYVPLTQAQMLEMSDAVTAFHARHRGGET